MEIKLEEDLEMIFKDQPMKEALVFQYQPMMVYAVDDNRIDELFHAHKFKHEFDFHLALLDNDYDVDLHIASASRIFHN